MLKGDFDVKCPISGVNAKLLPTDEESKIHPSSIYGLTKQVQEQMCMISGKSLNIPIVAFRYQNVYGPGQSLRNPYTGIISIFSTRIKKITMRSTFLKMEKKAETFVYIQDVVDATILGIEKQEANYNVYNVGSGRRTSVLKVMQSLCRGYGIEAKYQISKF